MCKFYTLFQLYVVDSQGFPSLNLSLFLPFPPALDKLAVQCGR